MSLPAGSSCWVLATRFSLEDEVCVAIPHREFKVQRVDGERFGTMKSAKHLQSLSKGLNKEDNVVSLVPQEFSLTA